MIYGGQDPSSARSEILASELSSFKDYIEGQDFEYHYCWPPPPPSGSRRTFSRISESNFLRMLDSVESFVREQSVDLILVDPIIGPVALAGARIGIPVVAAAANYRRFANWQIPPVDSHMLPGPDGFSTIRVARAWALRYLRMQWRPYLRNPRRAVMKYLRLVRPLKRECRSIGLKYGFDDLGIQPRYPYFISSSAALDFSEAKNVRYLGLCIDESRVDEDFPWDEGSDERPLIYCSLGSQSYRYFKNAAARFLNIAIAAFLKRDDYRLILHIGVDRSPDEFGDLPPRIKVCSWAPQLAVLKRSAAAITTAGLGALKECVYSGVPMVALPGANDQPSNAARIVHHGLGVRGDLRRCTESDLLAMVDEVVRKPHYAENVRKMRARCMNPSLFEAGVDSIMALALGGAQDHATEKK